MRVKENVLKTYSKAFPLYGFENESEKTEIEQKPITLNGETLQIGDKIVGFESDSQRTEFKLKRDYMTYVGLFEGFMLFKFYESQKKPRQGNLFQKDPYWCVAFLKITEDSLQVFSSSSTSWDITINKILRYEDS